MLCFPFRPLVLACALLFSSSLAMAETTSEPTLQDIVRQQAALRSQVVVGKGAFRDMERHDREELAKHQQRVLDMLSGVSSLDELRSEQRTEVFNELEWIKSIVSKAEDERMVCEYTSSLGSNRRESKCMTARQQRERREQSQKLLRREQICGASGCGGN